MSEVREGQERGRKKAPLASLSSQLFPPLIEAPRWEELLLFEV